MMTLPVVTALCCRGTVLLTPLPSLATPRINGHFLHFVPCVRTALFVLEPPSKQGRKIPRQPSEEA